MKNDLYVVVGSDEEGMWTTCNALGNEVFSLEEAEDILSNVNAHPEVEEGVWKYRIAKLSFLD